MKIKTAASLAAAALGAVVFAGAYTVPAQAQSVVPDPRSLRTSHDDGFEALALAVLFQSAVATHAESFTAGGDD
ncbi:hypothetical protein [Streptosporangium sandarakinum]|uniref:Uncharacterized protein n=1 Tax=Streptosporangium sandarakinum TaxID=1260955 RepID=A0A852UZG3_9ACTN|nr:hypothetical protein [Streptosporangium sandarakinum]NYF43047.1 hypothetical protein [Streptosporangium sandarakinum]